MECEKLIYTNERGERLELSTESVYHCNVSTDVGGISGVTNVVYSTNSMGQHGDTYVGQRIETRTIDILGHIKAKNKQQAYELRRRLLKVFNPEISGTLVYEFGEFRREINCRMHGNPEFKRGNILLEFNLPLDCLNPFWREAKEEKETIASWVPAWEFPCEIEKNNEQSMVFGYRDENIIANCCNEGDISVGMRICFTASGTVINPVILNMDTEEFIKLNAVMLPGDVIEVNTAYGSKGAVLWRNGEKSDYFRYVDVDSTFMQLTVGDNYFRCDADSGMNSLEVSILYNREYLSV